MCNHFQSICCSKVYYIILFSSIHIYIHIFVVPKYKLHQKYYEGWFNTFFWRDNTIFKFDKKNWVTYYTILLKILKINFFSENQKKRKLCDDESNTFLKCSLRWLRSFCLISFYNIVNNFSINKGFIFDILFKRFNIDNNLAYDKYILIIHYINFRIYIHSISKQLKSFAKQDEKSTFIGKWQDTAYWCVFNVFSTKVYKLN